MSNTTPKLNISMIRKQKSKARKISMEHCGDTLFRKRFAIIPFSRCEIKSPSDPLSFELNVLSKSKLVRIFY